jgi:hypothetical protein
MATTTVAARTIYAHDASLEDVYGCAEAQLDEAARGDVAAPGTIEGAIVVRARGQRRDLQ